MSSKVHTAFFCALLLLGCGGEEQDPSTPTSDSLRPATCQEPFPVPEGCEEAACEMAKCGDPDSFLDEFRCERKHCETQEDCAPEEECRLLRYLQPSCGYVDEGGPCYCGSNLMGIDAMLCLPHQ